MKILIVLPARGGSKGIPRKNVALLNGFPLLINSLKNAFEFKKYFNNYMVDIVLSSDDAEILDVGRLSGCLVHKRTDALSSDEVTLDPVIYDVINQTKHVTYDHVITLQPTSPCLRHTTLIKAFTHYLDSRLDTLISAVPFAHLEWGLEDDSFIKLYKRRVNRQELEKKYIETGSFVITRSQFVSEINRIGPNVLLFCIPLSESIDIDERVDWVQASSLLEEKELIICFDFYPQKVRFSLNQIYSFLKHLADFSIIVLVHEDNKQLRDFLSAKFYRVQPYVLLNQPSEIIFPILCPQSSGLYVNNLNKHVIAYDYYPNHYVYSFLSNDHTANIIENHNYENSYNVSLVNDCFDIFNIRTRACVLRNLKIHEFGSFIKKLISGDMLFTSDVDVFYLLTINSVTICVSVDVMNTVKGSFPDFSFCSFGYNGSDWYFLQVGYNPPPHEIRRRLFNLFRFCND